MLSPAWAMSTAAADMAKPETCVDHDFIVDGLVVI
jgi:hypothetical protein